MKTRASVLADTGRLELQDVDLPELGLDGVLVQVLVTGVCGSDLAAFNGQHPYKAAPCVLGHELCGIVREVGPHVTDLVPGHLVCSASYLACGNCHYCMSHKPNLCTAKRNLSHDGWHGSFADLIVLRRPMVFGLPPATTPEVGALVEPLSIGLHAVDLAACSAKTRLLVVGAGFIGLASIYAAAKRGWPNIVALDLHTTQGPLAFAAGATEFRTTEEIGTSDLTLGGSPGYDAVIVAANSPAAVQLALNYVAPGGRVVVVSFPEGEAPLTFHSLVRTEIAIVGSSLSTPAEFSKVIEWLASDGPRLKTLVTHEFALGMAPQALQVMATRDTATGKVILRPGRDRSGAE